MAEKGMADQSSKATMLPTGKFEVDFAGGVVLVPVRHASGIVGLREEIVAIPMHQWEGIYLSFRQAVLQLQGAAPRSAKVAREGGPSGPTGGIAPVPQFGKQAS